MNENDPVRLLLVDDEVAFVQVLSKRLTKRNLKVTCAYSGTEAIQALRKEDFDIAVLDLKMDDMNGLDVLKIFKKMVPEMPVLMLTGHGSEQAAQEGIAKEPPITSPSPMNWRALLKKSRKPSPQGKN